MIGNEYEGKGNEVLLKILYIDGNQTVSFAGRELKRILEQVDSNLEVALCGMESSQGNEGIWLGTYEALGLKSPKVEDTRYDDAYKIDIHGLNGVIAGTNPRSVLLGIYRYLRELGCAWVRPGDKGEIIPKRSIKDFAVKLEESAAYRHRGVCIEGAVNFDHVNEMMKWLPKIGMNAYFNQFWTPFTFYDRWYQHTDNPMLKPETVSVSDVSGFVKSQLHEIRENDMLYHATGHGWTCEPFGLEGLGWYNYDGELPDGYQELLALVDGKRELFGGIPLNTNLCYSNPTVREKMIGSIVSYCQKNPDVNYLHFWLADSMNSHCECDECIKQRPSDNYVGLLNELDEQMSKEGIQTKIVFLLYFDLLWSPQKNKIKNQDRFVLQFAPISRTYSYSYLTEQSGHDTEEPYPFEYNKLKLPRSVNENLAYLRKWKTIFKGDSFVFDYHLWRDHLRDVGYAQISKVLFEDMHGLKKMGLNGMMSCQAQRVFSPSALPMLLMADALWDADSDYESCVNTHYRQIYGSSWRQVREYLEGVSKYFDSAYLRQEKNRVNPEVRKGYELAELHIKKFQPYIDAQLAQGTELHPVVRDSFVILKHHADLALLLCEALKHKSAGEDSLVQPAWEKAVEYARSHEYELKDEFDVFEFINVVGGSIARTEWEW